MLNFNSIRRRTREVRIGGVTVGGTSPIAVQSMTNTDTHDREATLNQVRQLEEAGCDIVRITFPDPEAADTIPFLKEAGIKVPLVADIHFDYRIALRCAELGIDKIRINPGNIGNADRVAAVCRACRERRIPIRIGVNSGSVEKDLLQTYGGPVPEALVESAFRHIRMLEANDFTDILVSIKSTDVRTTVLANRMLAERCDYPIHLGLTESGTLERGLVKSSAGIGSLLLDGIGDTVRVSLTEDPVKEVDAARQIFNALGLEGQSGLKLICCPTCGRTRIDLISLSHRFESAIRAEGLERVPVTVALMGCIVNGPGEAREADFGIAGGVGEALFFRHGEPDRKIAESEILPVLLDEIRKAISKIK